MRAANHALNQFVGRDAELQQLNAALRRAAAGRGQTVSLIGDAGLGKSRLVHEFLRTGPLSDWMVLPVSATQQTSSAVFHLAADLLRTLINVNSTDAAAEVARKLDHAAAALTGEPLMDARPLRWLLDLPVPDPIWGSLEWGARRAAVVAAMRQILLRETERQKVVVVVEDFHWADEPSVQVLSAIVDGMGAATMLVLVTARPDRRPAWSTRSYASEIELMPLEASSAEVLLCELLGSSDQLAPLRAHILEQAAGTPLFLEEIARSLVESGVVVSRPAQVVVTRDIADVRIPASVQAILATRIDRLPPVRRRLLHLASVIGKDVPLRLLAAVSDLPEAQLETELQHLQSAELLYEINFSFGREYTFKHVLTQNVAYESMLRRHRRELHGEVLRAIETVYADRIDEWTERLAGHALAGELWKPASCYALKAAERANRACAWQDAVKLLEGASSALAQLANTPETVQRSIDVRLQLRVALAALSDLPRLRSALNEARALEETLGNPLRLARIDTSRCLNLTMVGELEEAVSSGVGAHHTLRAEGEPGGIISSGFALGQAHWFRGEFPQALHVLRGGHHHARNGHALRNTGTTGTASVLYLTCLMRTHTMLGDFAAADAVRMQAREIADTLQRPFDLAELGQAEGFKHLTAGEPDSAVNVLRDALAIARSSHSALLLPIIAAVLGRALVAVGEIEEAEQLVEEALSQTDRHGYLAMRIWCGVPLGMVKAHRSAAAGRAELLAGLSLSRKHGFRPVEVQILRVLGDLSARQGDDDAAAHYAKAAVLARELGMKPELDAVLAASASLNFRVPERS